MAALAQSWWQTVTGYVLNALAVLHGDVQAMTVVPALGIACLVLGAVLALAWRVRRIGRMGVVLIAALLAPVAVSLANSVLGWVGMLFAVLAGALGLIIGTAINADSADRRLPAWLVGLFAIAFAAYSAIVGGAFTVFTG